MTPKQEKFLTEKYIRPMVKKMLKEERVQFANYYKNELSKLDTSGEYPCNVVIIDGNGNKTKHLNLNSESISIIIKWLKRVQSDIEKSRGK